jgi:hypothetical protein
MNRRTILRCCVWLSGCAILATSLTSPAHALILDLGFGLGPIPGSEYYSKYSAPENQKATVAMDLTGSIFADGSGFAPFRNKGVQPFQFTAPLAHYTGWPINTGGPATIQTNPITSPPYAQLTTDHWISGVDSIDNFGLELLNGQSINFALDATATTTASSFFLRNLELSFAGSLTSLHFQQTGVGIDGWRDGDITATIQFQPTALSGLIFDEPVIRTFSIPTTLMGNWNITPSAGFGPKKLSLDGWLNLAIPLSLATNFNVELTTPSAPFAVTMSSTVDLQASMFLELAYHLEQRFSPTPEPGSIVLLGIGLAAISLYGLGRRSARSKGS